ncbi:hypothetical protein [Nannocystis pusilla]|uniref:Uncharacterized protein n=1 Tax=Nannocystis pusilla TaxID=889268 RepID=A0ABS7U3E8_9BACT|nr:hypothetical protein [Nannocystis pusilla]MBZ5714850.1 hypothetical protein [Nannocystis pusilla]
MRRVFFYTVIAAVAWSMAAPRGALAQETRPPPPPPPPAPVTEAPPISVSAAPPPALPANAAAQTPAAAARPAMVSPRDDSRRSLRTGLLIGSVVTQAIGVGLDLATARAVADRCERAGEACRPGGGEMLGVGLGALASYVTSFGLAAGLGYVQGGLRAARSPATTIGRTRAIAWVGGLLVGAGLVGAAWSGLETQAACDKAGCDPQRALTASLVRGASTLSASLGVGMLSWREGMRRVHTGLALGPGRIGVAVRLAF